MSARNTKTRFPKGHTRSTWQTRNMSREYLDRAAAIAALRQAAQQKGCTVESVILDCLRLGLPTLERDAHMALDTHTKESRA